MSSEQHKGESGLILFILYILQTITVSIEVFIRQNMGERYMTFIRSFLLVSFFILFSSTMNTFIAAFDTSLMKLFMIASLIFAIRHVMNAKERHKKNIELHSYYNGTPILKRWFPNISEAVIKSTIEPTVLLTFGITLFVVGRYVFYPFYGLGLYITVVSIILFIKSQIEYSISRNRYLDVLDKKIESEMLNDAMEGKDAAKTKGFSVAGAKTEHLPTRQSIEQMYRKLDPALRRLMTPSKEKEHTPELAHEPISLLQEPPKDLDNSNNKDENEIDRDL